MPGLTDMQKARLNAGINALLSGLQLPILEILYENPKTSYETLTVRLGIESIRDKLYDMLSIAQGTDLLNESRADE